MVVEIPPGLIVGLIDDFWQRSLSDVGLPGPDGDKGGKFVILPPGYKGDVPKDGSHVLQGRMNNYNIMVRGILGTGMGDAPAAVETVKKFRVYPWSGATVRHRTRSSPSRARRSTRFRPRASNTGRASLHSSTTTPWRIATASSWRCSSRWALKKTNHSSPTRDSARSSRTQPASVTPWDERCYSTERTASAVPSPGATRTGTGSCSTVLIRRRSTTANSTSGCTTPTAPSTHRPISDRRNRTGVGIRQAFKDASGNRFDGGKSCRLHVPAKVPAGSFWSLTIYDSATRSIIANPSHDGARSSYDKLQINADGSIDFYFGPKAPALGEQLDRDSSRQGLLSDVPVLHTPLPGVFDGT